MKRYALLGLILLSAACEMEHGPVNPTFSETGTIRITLGNEKTKSYPDSLSNISKTARPSTVNQLEVRVLDIDKTLVVSKTFDPSGGYFEGTIQVKAQDDLKVLCIGTNDGVVERFGFDDDVDVKPGIVTDAVITEWDSRFIPEIKGISPNPSTDGSYTITWNTAPNATSYVLQEADNQQFSGAVASYSTTSLQISISGNAAGTCYYRVQASTEYNIKSGWSLIESAVVQNTHTISGIISGADGVTVTLGGDVSEIHKINDGETYLFTVAEGGSYTVTPSKKGYSFTPANQTFNNVTSSHTLDFSGAQDLYTISGTVTGADGVAIIMGGDASGSLVVNDGGSYSFTVEGGDSYTIMPFKTEYIFNPASISFTEITSNQTQNFAAISSVTTYTISGTVSGADGVTVTLGGDTSGSLVVNDGGSYSFTVAEGGNYIVTPSKSGFFFTPSVKNFDNVTADQTQNFAANVITYTISGTVSGADGVTITLSGDSSGSQVVDDGGSYSFTVAEGGNYTVFPSKSGFFFTPAIKTFDNVTTNQTQNFDANVIMYMISGTVSGADEVTITLSGDDSGNIPVDDGGTYTFIVHEGGNYTIIPSKDGYEFSPESKTFNNVMSNQTLDFSAEFLGKIAFTSNRDGNNEIYVMNADGSNQTRLTDNSADDMYPSWSPDGSRIAFTSHREGNFDIYVMDADGSNQTRLTDKSVDESAPSWSPDGSHIVFDCALSGLGGANWEIYVMNADGSNRTRLTYELKNDRYPSWSPDGSRIVFSSNRVGLYVIYVMDSDGSNQTWLTDEITIYFCRTPSWSPDGLKIVYSSGRALNYAIYVMNSDGSNQTGLTDKSANNISPSWSPDGSRIVFSSNRDGNAEIYVMDADGSNQTRLTDNSYNDDDPSWTPF